MHVDRANVKIVTKVFTQDVCHVHQVSHESIVTMSAGKKVRCAATPKSVEVKGPMTNPSASKQSAPNMSNKNSGSSPSSVSKHESESATNAGFTGTKGNLNIVVETTEGHTRNSGSALRGGASRKSSHKSGNRYGA